MIAKLQRFVRLVDTAFAVPCNEDEILAQVRTAMCELVLVDDWFYVYGADIGRVRKHVFDADSGAVKEFVSGYSNVAGASV